MIREFAFRFTPTLDLRPDWLLGSFRPWLDQGELFRLSRLRRVEDQREYVAAHALLRTTVSEFTGSSEHDLCFATDQMGKPFLCDGGVLFSLTHCRGLVSCAVARKNSICSIGVDAEPLISGEKLESMIDSFAGVREQKWLRRHGRREALVELWTAKEAVLKARGTGLADVDGVDALQAIHCEFIERDDCDVTRLAVGDEYAVHCWRLATGHVLSLAVSPPQENRASPAPEKHELVQPGSPGAESSAR